MSPMVQKTALKIAVGLAGSALLGYVYKLDKTLSEAIDRRYDDSKEDDN